MFQSVFVWYQLEEVWFERKTWEKKRDIHEGYSCMDVDYRSCLFYVLFCAPHLHNTNNTELNLFKLNKHYNVLFVHNWISLGAIYTVYMFVKLFVYLI